MPLITTDRKRIMAGNGTKTYTFSFTANDDEDIYLKIKWDATGVTEDISKDDFTVSLSDSGGSLTITNEYYPAPTIADELTIYRLTSAQQTADFLKSGSIDGDILEDVINKAFMILQEVDETDIRQLTLDINVSGTVSASLPGPEADAFLAWNSDADAIVNIEDPRATCSGYADDAAASATEASGYTTTAAGHVTTALGHANDAASSASDAADRATDAWDYMSNAQNYSSLANDYASTASDYANLSQSWATSLEVVADGLRGAKYYAEQAYNTVYSGVEPTFPVGTRMWFYSSSPPPGWEIVAGTGDKLVGVSDGSDAYATVSGGNTAGSWGFSGFTTDTVDAHSHTVSHNHDMSNHTHTGPSHTHTGPSHTHNMEHTHNGAYHRHVFDSHTHTLGSHTHGITATTKTIYGASDSYIADTPYCSVVGSVSSPTGSAGGSTGSTNGYTDYQQGTTGAASSSNTGSGGTGNTGAGGTGNTGVPSTNNTSTATPTSSEAGNHDHEISHDGTDRPAACVGIIAEYVG